MQIQISAGVTLMAGRRVRAARTMPRTERVSLRIREDTKSDGLKIGSQSVSQTVGQKGQSGSGRRKDKERQREKGRREVRKRRGKRKERRVNAWQASTGSISRGKDKFLIGPRYTDDSLLVDLITPRYGGLYKPPSTARILITFCLKPAKLFLREKDRRVDSSVRRNPISVVTIE